MPLRPESGNGEGVHLLHSEGGRQTLDLLEGMDTLHRGEHAARCKQMPCQRDELGNFGERAGNDAIEFFTGEPSLDPLAYHGGVVQLKVRYRLPEEGRFFVIAVEQYDLNVGPGQRNGNPGKSRAAAGIQHPGSIHIWDHGEAVEQMTADHLLPVPYGGQVVYLVPLLQQREIFKELVPLAATQRKTYLCRSI